MKTFHTNHCALHTEDNRVDSILRLHEYNFFIRVLDRLELKEISFCENVVDEPTIGLSKCHYARRKVISLSILCIGGRGD